MFAFDKPFVWVIILIIVLLVFGAGRLPEIGRSLGKSIKEFKDETQTGMNGTATTASSTITSDAKSFETLAPASSVSEPTIRRRVIKYPDGREEVIEEQVAQSK